MGLIKNTFISRIPLKFVGQLQTNLSWISVGGIKATEIANGIIFFIKDVFAVEVDVKLLCFISNFDVYEQQLLF
jgi:hypothetical protein